MHNDLQGTPPEKLRAEVVKLRRECAAYRRERNEARRALDALASQVAALAPIGAALLTSAPQVPSPALTEGQRRHRRCLVAPAVTQDRQAVEDWIKTGRDLGLLDRGAAFRCYQADKSGQYPEAELWEYVTMMFSHYELRRIRDMLNETHARGGLR